LKVHGSYRHESGEMTGSVKVAGNTGEKLPNDLYCVEWGVKLYSLTHSLTGRNELSSRSRMRIIIVYLLQ